MNDSGDLPLPATAIRDNGYAASLCMTPYYGFNPMARVEAAYKQVAELEPSSPLEIRV